MTNRQSLSGPDWSILGLIPSEWVWRRIGEKDVDLSNINPPVGPWTPAMVPGDVQSDLLDAGVIATPDVGLNSRTAEWVSQRDWVYRRRFQCDELPDVGRATLRFEGVDFSCHVFLNGAKLGTHQGTYTAFEFDVADQVVPGGENELVVVVEHVPDQPDQHGQIGWTGQVRLWKPRFAYNWDWCTRLVPMGIYDDVELIIDPGARITDVQVQATPCAMAPGSKTAPASVSAMVTLDCAAPGRYTVGLSLVPAGCAPVSIEVDLEAGANSVCLETSMPAAELWYPIDIGPQPLYTAIATLGAGVEVLDTRETRFGVRQFRMVANDGAPDTAYPYVIEINGVRAYIRGWNWVPLAQLYGREHRAEYRHSIAMAAEAHCNLLRVWGGGLLERRHFYELCDETGIMVWQEFPQSSSGIDNRPSEDPAYVAYVAAQARQMVPRRSNHVSLVVWCGGNELCEADYTPVTEEHAVIRILGEIAQELDRDTYYLPTSPSGPVFAALPENVGRMHDVHGHWLYLGNPDHYRFFNTIDPLLHSEFGAEGAANIETLRRAIPAEHLWPPDNSNPHWVHRGAWWLHRPAVEKLFGPMDAIEPFVEASQWVQYEGLRYGVESALRRQWRTSGCMPWQMNEPWPNASGTYSLDYYGHAKPVFWAVRRAYAPLAVSLSYDSLVVEPGTPLTAGVWMSAGYEAVPGTVRWSAYQVGGGVLASGTLEPPAGFSGPASAHLGSISVLLPPAAGLFEVRLEIEGCPEATNAYLFSSHDTPALQPVMRWPGCDLHCKADATGVCLSMPVNSEPALFVHIDTVTDLTLVQRDTGYLPVIRPGETVLVRCTPGLVSVRGLNVEPHQLSVG